VCLANVYQNENGRTLIVKEVAYLKVDGDRVKVENLAGETKVLQGRIKEIDFMNSDILVEKAAQQSRQRPV
jgi:predicted RNA-binding protein